MPVPLRVLLAHPDALVREALGSLLAARAGLDVTAIGADLDAGTLPGPCGADVALACASLVRRLPCEGPPVVALLAHGDPGALRRRALGLLDAGVAGLVSTADTGGTVAEAVLTVAQGGIVFTSPHVGRHLSEAGDAPGVPDAPGPLTPRERDVVGRAALGHSNVRIAADLGLAPGTVRNYLSAVYAALDVGTRAEAVAWAWRHGLVADERSGA